MDLLSTVIQFRARQNADQLCFSGRQVQAWFLREVERHRPVLATLIHDGFRPNPEDKHGFRPYTCSSLYKGPHVAWKLAEGDWCWLRLTSLTAELSGLLTQTVLPDLIPVAKIGQVELDVVPWQPQQPQNPWVADDTYASLVRQAALSTETRLEMEFSSITSFKKKMRQNGFEVDVPLPVPEMVFGNYLNHWSAFSGEQLPETLWEFVEECLVINELEIHSERAQLQFDHKERAATGFVGRVRFAILGGKGKSRFGVNWEHLAALVRMLAAYSFYCGTGQDTTVGLGQTRVKLQGR